MATIPSSAKIRRPPVLKNTVKIRAARSSLAALASREVIAWGDFVSAMVNGYQRYSDL